MLMAEEVLTQLERFLSFKKEEKKKGRGSERTQLTGLVTAALILSGIHTIVSPYNGQPSVRHPRGQTSNLPFECALWKKAAPASRRFSIHSPPPNAITGQPRNNALPRPTSL